MKLYWSLCVFFLVGCANTTHQPVQDENSVSGIRYYDTSPYLLIYPSHGGGIHASIEHLPDPTKKMSVDPYAYMAKNKSILTFTSGVLTKTEENIDTTVVPVAILDTIKGAADIFFEAFNTVVDKENEYVMPAPSIFKIVYVDDQVLLVGGTADTVVKMTVVPQAAK